MRGETADTCLQALSKLPLPNAKSGGPPQRHQLHAGSPPLPDISLRSLENSFVALPQGQTYPLLPFPWGSGGYGKGKEGLTQFASPLPHSLILLILYLPVLGVISS